ncbi:MAG: VCBS repeat-containing protein [Saprospiraceae bacterium]|nr:VCBS repeat-containing protein [Saprospiraceae bacterium]
MKKNILAICVLVLFAFSCQKTGIKQEAGTPVFKLLEAEQTGLDFSNDLTVNLDFNIFKYMYYYNGSGVGVGDFNNDGLLDLFFSGNRVSNKLYVNKGGLKFQDITEGAGLGKSMDWANGVAVVDINQDELLDIYVSVVGNYLQLQSHNKLYINKGVNTEGVPQFEEQSKQYGLDLVGFGTQATFFDYDLDGDLDMFQLNHSLHNNGTFGPRAVFQEGKYKYHPLSGDRFFKNENGKFVEITKTVGIYSNALGYGLGLVVGDINGDGYPDMYIGNDFHENDYLYINQRNGTFKEQITDYINHTSTFSMGVDIGDLNNDGWNDLMSLDMQPYTPSVLKASEGEDAFGIYQFKRNYGYNHQYARNALQINNGNGTMSEIATYSGVQATDWSWATLFFDFDNDGNKDIFISNGIPKRMNDIDYIKFAGADEFQSKIVNNTLTDKDLDIVRNIPEIKLDNKLYRNEGDLKFKDQQYFIKNNKISYSNGAAYADLDNDGDLDIVTTNINDKAFVYENLAKKDSAHQLLTLKLVGSEKNRNAIGSKLIAYRGDSVMIFEKYPTRGFQSSMETPLYAGVGNPQTIDSLVLVWTDNTFQKLDKNTLKWQGVNEFVYKKGLQKFDYQRFVNRKKYPLSKLADLTLQTQLDFKHTENDFVELNREPLLPHLTSTDGPALAVGDVNGDGLDDVFVGNAKWERAGLFLQNKNGTFSRKPCPAFDLDSTYEDVDALLIDVDNDKDKDLVVGTGGNEFYNNDEKQQSRVYLNDGKANFTRLPDAFKGIYSTVNTLQALDFNGDGFLDLFLGARSVVWAYGETPQSYLLQNDGHGHFSDVTPQYNKDLSKIGMVKNAVLADVDKDGDQDLIVAVEWDGIYAFLNEKNSFKTTKLTDKRGWWNFILTCDVDNDGDLDFIAGNLGQNSRLKASEKEPVRMYYNDYDGNGKKEQIVTYYLQGKEHVFATIADLQRQVPILKKKILYARKFAEMSLEEIFTAEKLKKAQKYEANYFDNAVLINQGNGKFETVSLPDLAQWTPYMTAQIIDANGDNLPDVLMYGNYFGNNIQLGRYDADYGKLLINKGNGHFEVKNTEGVQIKGEVRRMLPLQIGQQKTFILGINNEKVRILKVN